MGEIPPVSGGATGTNLAKPRIEPTSSLFAALNLEPAMPRSASVAFALALGVLDAANLGAQTLSTADIAARAAPATVMILTFDGAGDTTGLGSGFIVKSSGVIVTNWHVVAGAARAAVRLSTGEIYDRVDALDGDEDADLAILKVPGFGMPTLTPQATLPSTGSRLVAIGSPLGLSHTVSEGIVSASRLQNGRELLQMTVPISPGSSGGPVLNASGQVVAVATKYMTKGQQLNFAVPVRYAMGLVEGAATPRPFAVVFGGPGAGDGSVAAGGTKGERGVGTGAAAGAAGGADDDLPDVTTSPRESLVGSYRGVIHTRFTMPDGTKSEYHDTIQIHLSAEDKGVALIESNERRSKAFVLPVLTSSTTPDGRVLLDLGLAPMNGYQTDNGILAVGERKRDDGKTVGVALLVERSLPPLTASTGLYRLSLRTTYRKNGKDLAPMDWQGHAAVVVIRDSAFIDLKVENDQGGSTGGYFVGKIRDGRFRAKSGKKNPNQVDITFHSGRFIGEWTDERDGAKYIGSIEGRRE